MERVLGILRGADGPPATTEIWRSFRRQGDDPFKSFFGAFTPFGLKPFSDIERGWSNSFHSLAPLAVDVAESEKAYTITAEHPGVSQKETEIGVSNRASVIKGEKCQESEKKGKICYLRSYGSFQRIFSVLESTDESKIEAQYHNGVLSITVPKNAEAPNARKVDVNAA